jgi:hypothetical protein
MLPAGVRFHVAPTALILRGMPAVTHNPELTVDADAV